MSINAAHLAENNIIGIVVLQLTASDADLNANALFDYVTVSVTSSFDDVNRRGGATTTDKSRDFFHINSRGVVSATSTFDRELCSHFRLFVNAVDRGLPAQTGSTTVDVFIDDVNDERPMFVAADGLTATTSYSFRLVENETPGGTLIGTVTARDMDATPPNNRIQYSFVASTTTGGGLLPMRTWEQFVLDSDTGDIYIRSALDREQQSVYVVKVTAFDAGRPTPMTSSAMVTIHVDDVNDNDPSFEFPLPCNGSVSVSSRTPVGHEIARVAAHDPDAGRNARLTYRVIQHGGWFRMDPDSGSLYVEMRFADDAEYQLVVVVSDAGDKPRSATASLIVHINGSLPFPVHAVAGDVIMSPAEVVRFGLIASGGAILLLAILVLVAVAIARRRTDCCDVGEKHRRRVTSQQTLSAGYDEQPQQQQQQQSQQPAINRTSPAIAVITYLLI